MRYIDPEIKITMFDMETVRTGENGELQRLEAVSANYNPATKSLEEKFYTLATGSTRNILVFKWE